jgi:DNA-binding NarL/FixJ family response regulator
MKVSQRHTEQKIAGKNPEKGYKITLMTDEAFEIAVVDDEEWVRRGLISKLSKSGLPVRNIKDFADGESVLTYIEKGGRPDIMICDIRMPGVDGLRLAFLVRDRLPESRVIISSGYSEFEYAKQAIRAGVSEYLLKPIDNIELFVAVKSCMESISLLRRNGERFAHLLMLEREDKARRSLVTSGGSGDLSDLFPAYAKNARCKAHTQFICGYFRVPGLNESVFHDLVNRVGPEFLDSRGMDNSICYSCAPEEYSLLFLALTAPEQIRKFAEALELQSRTLSGGGGPAGSRYPVGGFERRKGKRRSSGNGSPGVNEIPDPHQQTDYKRRGYHLLWGKLHYFGTSSIRVAVCPGRRKRENLYSPIRSHREGNRRSQGFLPVSGKRLPPAAFALKRTAAGRGSMQGRL